MDWGGRRPERSTESHCQDGSETCNDEYRTAGLMIIESNIFHVFVGGFGPWQARQIERLMILRVVDR